MKRVPEAATEDAGDKEPRQAWQAFQKIHHKIQDKLQAEQKYTVLLRGEPFPRGSHTGSPALRAPASLVHEEEGPGTKGDPTVSGEKMGSGKRMQSYPSSELSMLATLNLFSL